MVPFDPEHPLGRNLGLTRREFFGHTASGIGSLALASILPEWLTGQEQVPGVLGQLHHAATAKRIIYLFQAGGPAQQDLFDYKPLLSEKHGLALPDEVRRGQRLTAMTVNQGILPLARSPFEFKQHGESGAWVSELLPHIAEIVDDICFVKSMFTEAINHDPAITFFQTGSQIAGDRRLDRGFRMGSDRRTRTCRRSSS